jgi:large subunit ribosomal protein L22
VTGPKTNEREGTRAFLRGAPMSAYKVRPVLDLIRGQDVGRAADILRFCERGPAEAVGKLLASAVANAAHNDELDPEELFVSACFADESKTQRRMRPRARGRATRIRKRSAHITIIVGRLPENRLARLRAQRAAEQATRRSRRGGGRGAAPTDRARRTGRRSATDATPAEQVVDELVVDEVLADEAIEATAVEATPIEATPIDVTDETPAPAEDAAVEETVTPDEPIAEDAVADDATPATPEETPPASGADHTHGSTE